MRRSLVLGCWLLGSFFCGSTFAVVQPVCDAGECGPNPGSSGYSAVALARTKPRNARGGRGPFPVQIAPGGAANTLGSQSYNYAIPILRLPGRNGLDLDLTLYYNSRVWQIDPINNTAVLNADRDFPSYGFRLDFGFLEYDSTNDIYILTEGDGAKRLLFNNGGLYQSQDSSYTQLDPINKIIDYKNGTRVQFTVSGASGFSNFFNPTLIQDTNGNRIAIAYNTSNHITSITDTLGRVITYNYFTAADGALNGLLKSITQAVPAGTKTWATFSWNINQLLTYNFSGAGFVVTAPGNTTGSSFQPATGSAINALASCTYANGAGYKFLYGPNGEWGVIFAIQNVSASSPQAVRSSISYNFPVAVALNDAPAYTQQTVFDGVNGVVFNYAITKSGSGLVSTYAVTDPFQVKTTTTLFTAGDFRDGLVASVDIRNSSNTVLRTVTNDWTADPTTNRNPRVCRTTSTLNDSGQQSKVEYLYSGETAFCASAVSPTGNVIQQNESDFGLVLKRQTLSTFKTNFTPHILDRPLQVIVKDASGSTIARTDFDYDLTPVASISGTAPNHDDQNYGTGFTQRGNLTKITRYSNAAAGTGPIIRNFTYDMLGNLVTRISIAAIKSSGPTRPLPVLPIPRA